MLVFIRKLANRVIHVNNGSIKSYPGGYNNFIEKSQFADSRAALTAE